MAKKKAATKEKGKQLDLIDVLPEKAKPIIKVAREYIKHRDARMAVQKKEVECKHRILELVKAAKIKTLNGGIIKFSHDGVEISVTPKEMELKVKES